jgi:dihydroflavonol-4-reductase
MNILITGITGLFGSQLAKEFSQAGNIHGLRRSSSNLGLLEENLEVSWHEGDLMDVDSLLEALQGIDLVIHSAGMVSFSPKDSEAVFEINTQGTANLVDAMMTLGVNKLIHISSVAALGRTPGILEVDENFKWTESPLNSDYAVSKYRAELEVWRAYQEGLQVLVVNPSTLIGKISSQRSSTAVLDYVMEENKFYPLGCLNYIDVRDASRITWLLFEKEAWGERFVLNKESVSYFEFFKTAASVFSKKAPNIPVNGVLSILLSRVIGFLRFFGLSKSQLTKQSAQIAQQKIYFRNQKVNKLLGFRYTDLEESLLWAKTD